MLNLWKIIKFHSRKRKRIGKPWATVTLQATGLNECTLYYYYVEVTDDIAIVSNAKNSQRTYCSGNAYSCSGSTNYCSGTTTTSCTCSHGRTYQHDS